MELKLRIEQLEEALKGINEIKDMLQNLSSVKEVKSAPVEKTVETPKEETKSKEVTYTASDVRKAFLEKNSKENRPKLKEILEQLGSDNISSLQQDQYAKAMEMLEALS